MLKADASCSAEHMCSEGTDGWCRITQLASASIITWIIIIIKALKRKNPQSSTEESHQSVSVGSMMTCMMVQSGALGSGLEGLTPKHVAKHAGNPSTRQACCIGIREYNNQ